MTFGLSPLYIPVRERNSSMIVSGRQGHWERIYSTRAEAAIGWYQDDFGRSHELIQKFAPSEEGRIIDIGGGTSALVDRPIKHAFERMAVLDISQTALLKVQGRLAEVARIRPRELGRLEPLAPPDPIVGVRGPWLAPRSIGPGRLDREVDRP